MLRVICSAVVVVLGATCCFGSESSIEAFRKLTGPDDRGTVEVAEVHDLDNIEIRADGHEARVALANLVPFARWPKDLGTDAAAIKQAAVAAVKKELLGKEIFVELRAEPKGSDDRVQVDLIYVPSMHGREKIRWKGQRPSEQTGWGYVTLNLLFIERGYSPPVDQTGVVVRPPFHKPLFPAAEDLAKEKHAGIWKSDRLSKALRDVATSLSPKNR